MAVLRKCLRRPGGTRSSEDANFDAFVQALSGRDMVTGEHLDRVACIATEIGHVCGVSDDQLLAVEVGARLHSLNRLAIPESILEKAGPLSRAEWNVLRHHPQIGAALVRAVPTLSHLAEAIEAHHERWDGKGYPHALEGEEIPLAARIFALGDSINAMAAGRAHQPERDWRHIADELRRHGGSQWDPRLTELTLASLDSIQALERGCPHGFSQAAPPAEPVKNPSGRILTAIGAICLIMLLAVSRWHRGAAQSGQGRAGDRRHPGRR